MKQKILFLLIFFLILISSEYIFGQDSTFKKIETKGWTTENTSLRFGLGLQKSLFFELGLSRVKYVFNGSGIAAFGYYAMTEWTPKNNIYGLKLGSEMNIMGGAFGLDLKYLQNSLNKDFVITPKIGIGGASFLILYYGYNFSVNDYPFSNIGRHQFSLVSNINKAILTGKHKYPKDN